MPEPRPGIEGQDWIRVAVRCPACGKQLVLKVVPGTRGQRWAFPFCHTCHVGGSADA